MAKHILLAEDSVTMQKAIEMTLAGEDVTLTVTATVEEALARARQRRPDLVLADLSLPGKNGYDLAAAIKQEDRSIPVLLLHGIAVTFDPQRAMRSGADGEVVKPFETQLLIDRVWALMDGSEAGAMPGPVEPLGEPLSGSTLAPAGAVAAGAARRAAPAPRSVGAGPPLGTISTAPGTGSGVLPPPPVAAGARPAAAVPAAAAPVAPRPAAAAPVAPRPAPAAPVAAAPVAARPAAAPVAAAPVAPRPAAPPVAPRPAAAAPVSPRPQPLPPLPEAVALASEPTALEITIEAELPPAVLAEPLPSFDVPTTTDIGRGDASQAGFTPVNPPRPLRTLAGWGEGGLPPPPPGMPLPRAAAGAGAPIAPPAAARELDPAAYEAIVKLSREVIERVAWEIVPELAETIIREQLERVLAQRSK